MSHRCRVFQHIRPGRSCILRHCRLRHHFATLHVPWNGEQLEGTKQIIFQREEHGQCFPTPTTDRPTVLPVSLSKIIALGTQTNNYRVSIGVTLTATVVLVIPSIPPVVKCCVTFPGAAVQNSMACRVFRLLRQGLHPNILAFEDQERLNLHQSNINEVPQIPNILAAPTVCHIPKHRHGSIV